MRYVNHSRATRSLFGRTALLQDRQARIENLLLMLTRGMRNEATPHNSYRHDTL